MDSLDTSLTIAVCLDKVERAIFCGEEDAIGRRNDILRVIGEVERCGWNYEKGRLASVPDWARQGLPDGDNALLSVNLAFARLMKFAGLLYGFGDYAARGRALEESLLADPTRMPASFHDESSRPPEVQAYYALMDENRRDLRAEIRPGGGVKDAPFWNGNARLFTYPPSFPFKEISGAAPNPGAWRR